MTRKTKDPPPTLIAYKVPEEPDDLHKLLRVRARELMTSKWDELSPSEQIRLLATVARNEVLYPKIVEGSHAGSVNSGSTVRKYEKAFKANAARERKPVSGDTTIDGFLEDDNDANELEY
jgi:hypothetical protein